MSHFGKVLPAVFGSGLLTLILALLGAFSTIFNGLQALNGLFCFDRVLTESSITESEVSSFAISGYLANHFEVVDSLCHQINGSNVVLSDPYPFCRSWNNESGQIGFSCKQAVKGTGGSNIYAYVYGLDVNCTTWGTDSSTSFQVSITPGSLSMTGVPSSAMGYPTTAVVRVYRCTLSKHFYVIFSSICVAVTGAIFLLRAFMRTCCVHFWGSHLSNSVTLYWVFKILERYGFFDFYNPYINEPYYLVKGEMFYTLQAQGGGDHAKELEYGGNGPSRAEGKVIFVDSFAWSSSNSVYKFTYDNGKMYAYSKDHCGFETVSEANVSGSVALVIREYLRLKSQSVCITNEEKIQFVSLHGCCRMAKGGYTLVQQIADDNYHMFGRKENINLHSNDATNQPERELHLFESRSSLLRS